MLDLGQTFEKTGNFYNTIDSNRGVLPEAAHIEIFVPTMYSFYSVTTKYCMHQVEDVTHLPSPDEIPPHQF